MATQRPSPPASRRRLAPVLPRALLCTAVATMAALAGPAQAAPGCTPGAPPLTELSSWSGARLGAAPFAPLPAPGQRPAMPAALAPPMLLAPSMAPRAGTSAIEELARAAGGSRAAPGGAAGYVPWLAPVAVAARGPVLYVADAGRRQIYRYDLAQQSMTPFAPLPAPAAGSVPAMVVGPDLSLYVSDGAGRRVLHYGYDGRPLGSFADELGLARPSGLALEPDGGLLVADSLYRHVLRFDSLGHLRALIEPDQARAIDALAAGASGLYLLDRLGRQVLALTADGQPRAVIGAGALALAGPLALDRYQRLYVGDQGGQSVKLYQDGELLDGGEAAPRFGRIDGLAVEGDTLYVADSARARVVLLRVTPPCAGGDHGR
jgi:hypothetical protein